MSKSMTSTYIFFGICVLARWFLKEAYFSFAPLFVFFLLAVASLFVLLVALFIEGTIKIKKQKLKALIPFFTCLATILFILFFPVQEFRLRIEFYCYKPIREKIVQEIKESDIEYADDYKMELPWYISYVSADGTICVSKDWNNVEVDFLYIQGGELITPKSIAYSSKGLEENRCKNNEMDPIVKKLGDNWYYIEVY